MAKYFGKIGFANTVDKGDGVWEEEIVERGYFGDAIRVIRRANNSGQVNDNLVISSTIEIVADPYATSNLYSIRYVEYMGAKWKVESIEVRYPRLVLNLGGVYNA